MCDSSSPTVNFKSTHRFVDAKAFAAICAAAYSDRRASILRAIRYSVPAIAALFYALAGPQLTLALEPKCLAVLNTSRYGDLPVVTIDAGGFDSIFLVDTCCPVTALDLRHRRLVGNLRERIRGAEFGDAGRDVEVFESPRLSIGEIVHETGEVITIDFSRGDFAGKHIDGCLGLNVLRSHVLQFDFDRGQIRFFDSLPPDSGIGFDLLTDPQGLPAVRIAVGTADLELFALRTGTTDCLQVSPSLFSRWQNTRQLVSFNARDIHEARLGRFGIPGIAAKVTLGNFVHREVPVKTGATNQLGLGLLSHYIVTFDFPSKRVHFKPGNDFSRNDCHDQSGLKLADRNGRHEITAIHPSSPAAASGFLEYDAIVAIDHRSCANLSLFDLRRALQRKGATLQITVARDDRLVDLMLPLCEYRSPPTKGHVVRSLIVGHSRMPTIIAETEIAKDGEPVVIPVTLGDSKTPILMLVDTGSPHSFFDASLRARLGKRVARTDVQMVDGHRSLELFRTPRLRFQGLQLSEETLSFLEYLAPFNEMLGADFSGILGMDVLRHHIVQIDCDAGALRILSRLPDDPGTRVEIGYRLYGNPEIPVSVAGIDDAWFTVDTGYFHACAISERMISKLRMGEHLFRAEPSYRLDWRTPPSVVGRLSQISVAGQSVNDIRVTSHDTNILGMVYLAQHVITFDFPRQALYLKPSRSHRRSDPDDMSGISVIRREQEYIVSSVWPRSPAADSGLAVGDQIETIDGLPVRGATVSRLRRLLASEGNTIHVGIRRRSRELQLVIRLRDYYEQRAAETFGNNDFTHAIENGARRSELYRDRARFVLGLNRIASAIEDLDLAIEYDPNNADLFIQRAELWQQLERDRNAYADYSESIRLEPRKLAGYQKRSAVSLNLGDFLGALADANKAVALAPGDSSCYGMRAMIEQMMGDCEAAMVDYESSQSLDPTNAYALSGMALLLSSCPIAEHRDGGRALKLAEAACSKTGWNDPYCLGAIAAAYAEQRDFEKAQKWQAVAVSKCSGRDRDTYSAVLQMYRGGKAYRMNPACGSIARTGAGP